MLTPLSLDPACLLIGGMWPAVTAVTHVTKLTRHGFDLPGGNNAPSKEARRWVIPDAPGHHIEKELRRMSIAQFRADLKRARNKRRLYARINALPSDSTDRNELLAIARRSEDFAR